MVKNISYDRVNYNNNTIPNADYTVKGILTNKTGVCEGYALTFKLFMDMLDVECIYVSGKNSSMDGHAWNMVKLYTDWYHIDVTWDANSSHNSANQFSGTVLYTWFLKDEHSSVIT